MTTRSPRRLRRFGCTALCACIFAAASAQAAQVATPTFTPTGGGFTSPQTVTISCTTAGASIVYTTDGSTPTESGGTVTHGTLYSGPISVGFGTTVLAAVAFESGMVDSNIGLTSYSISLPSAAIPTFSPGRGTYSGPQSVTISTTTSGASIVYTTDGSMPTESGGTITHGTLYTGPVTVSVPFSTLTAIAFKSGYSDSFFSVADYWIVVGVPAFSLASGTYASAQSVSITTSFTGATIYYTTDGSTPTLTKGTIYTGPVTVSSSMSLKAIAYKYGFTTGPTMTAIYIITSSPAVILNVIHDFSASSNEGDNPYAGLIDGGNGYFYGVTYGGGYDSVGTAFKVTPAGVLTTLTVFGGYEEYPFAGLVQGSDGNFYGTTNPSVANSSSSDPGLIFKMTPGGTLTTLATFNGANGKFPFAGLVQGGDGNFYGATLTGGGNNYGTVYKVTLGGVLTDLASFAGSNGLAPAASLVQGSDGNFYGTTFYGGSTYASGSNPGLGTLFKMTPAGVLTSLVSFSGPNGEYPGAPLVQGSDGNFYGTTTEDNAADKGTIFKVTPTGTLTTLAFFNGTNGAAPNGLVQGSDGNFYGTANIGGDSNDDGTIFGVTPTGSLTVLATFDGANGSGPLGNLVQGSDGNFYGTTPFGGATGEGVIFQVIMPTIAAAPTFSPSAGTYTSAQTVTITSSTVGATIRYTTDGSAPSKTVGALYAGPVSISATTTLKAIAFKSGLTDSAVTSGTYTITPPSAPPATSGGGGGGGGAPSMWFFGALTLLGALRWRRAPKTSV